jgi:hypothetical protein
MSSSTAPASSSSTAPALTATPPADSTKETGGYDGALVAVRHLQWCQEQIDGDEELSDDDLTNIEVRLSAGWGWESSQTSVYYDVSLVYNGAGYNADTEENYTASIAAIKKVISGTGALTF